MGSSKATTCIRMACVVMVLALQIATVQAGGLYTTEFGTPSQGASGAGSGVLAEDASTALLSPAGILQLEGGEWMVTGIGIFSSVKFDQSPGTTVGAAGNPRPGSGDNGGDAGGALVAMSAFYAKPFSKNWGFGAALNSFSAAILSYESAPDFVGRYWSTEVDLLTLSLTPTVARRLSDNVSIAFGIPIMYGMLNMDVAIPSPLASGTDGWARISDGNDVSVTGTISALFEVGDRGRIGLAYAGENKLNFDSDLSIALPARDVEVDDISTNVEIPLPQTVRLSGSRDVSDRITLLGTIAWEDWSTFDNVLISTRAGSGELARDWDDTWGFRFGVRGRTDGPWTWYTGAAYDTNPTTESKRTADMPVDRQIRLSFGATYEMSQKTTLGGVLTYLDMGEAGIDNGGTRPITGQEWQVVGDYGTNRMVFLGFSAGWR
jgi:long-chain fatty acid transport protein